MAQSKTSELVLLPLGGIGEIGMNMYLYGLGPEHKRQWLMVDIGITFPDEREPGVDVILPDITFIEEERKNLSGILITHAHEDHYGALMDLWPQLRVPVYATGFSLALLKAKMNDYNFAEEIELNKVEQGARFDIGPFDVELVPMAHSIPETNGIIIRTEQGTVFHSGDWKLDEEPGVGKTTDETRLQALGQEGVDVLVCDSTNAMTEGFSQSEGDVARGFVEVFKSCKNRIAVTTFSSNVARIKAIADAAKANERHLVVVGRALQRVILAAQETGHLPKNFEMLSDEDFGYLPRERVVVLCTGSQGEPRAAMSRIAQDTHPQISLAKGDTIIFSARTIPGNEKGVLKIQNAFAARGLNVITDKEAMVHVSGHPRRGELQQMYDWIKPQALIPMHGEDLHLQAHAQFAKSCGIQRVVQPKNGKIIRLLPEEVEIIDEAPVGRLFRDGDLIISEDDPSIQERRKLSFTGIVTVAIVLSKTGELISEPIIEIVGIPEEDGDGTYVEDIIFDEVMGVVESIPRPRRKDADLVSEAVRRGARSAVRQVWNKKPVCSVLVNVV
ncbi:MAG: ribonuclease J [Pseudomonadota bacterium]